MKLLGIFLLLLLPSTTFAHQWELLDSKKAAYIKSEGDGFPTNLIIGEVLGQKIGPDITIVATDVCEYFSVKVGSSFPVTSLNTYFNGREVKMTMSCPYKDTLAIGPTTEDKDYVYFLIETNKPIKFTMSNGGTIVFKNPNGKSTIKSIFH